MPAPGPLDSTHLLPIPQVDQPYGGTPQNPTFFWNSSLPEDDIVCGVNDGDVSNSCCPYAIGIRTESSFGCRMHNTTDNMQWYQNCTKQLWDEAPGRPTEDVHLDCRPFTVILQRAMYDYPDVVEGKCTVLGSGDMRLDYLPKCCDKLGGRISEWSSHSRQSAPSPSDPANPSMTATSCTLMPVRHAQWKECVTSEHGYPVCRADASSAAVSSNRPNLSSWTVKGLLVAAAVLAALV